MLSLQLYVWYAGGMMTLLAAIQHDLEWNLHALALFTFCQKNATKAMSLELLYRMDGIRTMTKVLRPVILEGPGDDLGQFEV